MFKRIRWKTGWTHRINAGSPGPVTYIGMGVNIGSHGERLRLLMLALQKMNQLPATRVTAVSSLYETPPWGVTDQAKFYNCVVALHSGLKPIPLLHRLKNIEVQLGRKHRQRWGPREIDLDIVQHGNTGLNAPGLTIPHKHLAERQFVLVPLLELDPQARLPNGQLIRHLGSAVI